MSTAKLPCFLALCLMLGGVAVRAQDHSLLSEEEEKSLHTKGSAGGNSFKIEFVSLLSADKAKVAPITELGSEHTIGSATRICPDARWLSGKNLDLAQKYEWYLTAAHVVRPKLKGIAVFGAKLDVAMRDDKTDLAVLRRPKDPSAVPAKCYHLSEAVTLPTLYDVNTVMSPSFDRSLRLETIDLKLNGVRLISNRAYTGYSVEHGVLGREDTGALILAGAAGFRGQSGGALSAWTNHDQIVDLGAFSDASEPELIGLILNFASDGHQVAALSSSIIQARLKKYFNRSSAIEADVSHQPYLRSSVAGGTRIENTSFIALRGSPDAGTGGQNDGGTGGQNDGGTGGQNDGGTSKSKSKLPRTGIWDSDQHIRYLAIGHDNWSENDGIPEEVIQELKTGSVAQTVFEKDGKVFVRGGLEALPKLIDPSSPGYVHLKKLPDDKADCYFSRGTYQMRRELTAADHAPPGTTFGAIAAESAHFICEEPTPTGKRWMIKSFVEPAYNDLVKGTTPSLESLKSVGSFAVEWKLKPLRAGADCARELCELEIQAPPGFKADGLRNYTSASTQFTITHKGGFEINVADPAHLQTMRFSGPSLAPAIKSFTETLVHSSEAPRADQVWKRSP